MPDLIRFSDLTGVITITDSDIFAIAAENDSSETGYTSVKATARQVASKVAEGTTFSNLETESKYIVPSINELKALISQIPQFDVQVVQTLPTTGVTGTVYLVPAQEGSSPNLYEEYLWVNNQWEKLGSASVDLSNYYNKAQINGMLADEFSTSESYEVGDYVIRENYLYRCISATSSSWDSSKWTIVKITFEIPKDLNDLDNVNIQNPTHRQGLVYDNPTGKWVNHTIVPSDISGLSTVATTGNYNDLSNKPEGVYKYNDSTGSDLNTLTGNMFYSVRSAVNAPSTAACHAIYNVQVANNPRYLSQVASTAGGGDPNLYIRAQWDGNWSGWRKVACVQDLATVATSGSYNDLSNKPVIPQNVFIYADGERQVGTWGNLGVYERILTIIDETVGQEQQIDISSWGIADVIKITATINRIAGGKEFKYPLPFYESANINGWCRWNSTDKTLDFLVNVEATTVKRFVVVYTKPTT